MNNIIKSIVVIGGLALLVGCGGSKPRTEAQEKESIYIAKLCTEYYINKKSVNSDTKLYNIHRLKEFNKGFTVLQVMNDFGMLLTLSDSTIFYVYSRSGEFTNYVGGDVFKENYIAIIDDNTFSYTTTLGSVKKVRKIFTLNKTETKFLNSFVDLTSMINFKWNMASWTSQRNIKQMEGICAKPFGVKEEDIVVKGIELDIEVTKNIK